MKQVVIMPGGFHPFHAGHAALYQSARQAFPGADVYVAATDDTSTRPFPFQVKEKLAQLAGVDKGRFMRVKSPFQATEITAPYNAEDTQLIFVRSQKDADKPPRPGGVKKNGEPGYLQPYNKNSTAPMSQQGYMAYLPTVEFGPGMTSATEIRAAWPQLNEKRKTALVMSLYPKTQSNPKLAANVVKMLDTAIGTEVAENQGWAATYESVGGMHASYQDRYNQPIDERDITSKLGTKRDQGKSVRKWRKQRGLDEQEQLSKNISMKPNQDPDSFEDWDYFYKDVQVAPGQDFHTQIKDQHLRQLDPAYDTMRNAFDNPVKPGPVVPQNQSGDTVIPSRPAPPQPIKDLNGQSIRLKDFVAHDPDILEDYVEEERTDPIEAATVDFYQNRVGDIGTKPVGNYKEIARELLGKTENPSMRRKIMDILVQGNKNPYVQGGIITTVAAIVSGGILTSAARMGLSPQQTNMMLQAILNTVVPTVVSRLNGKSWRDTVKYTLASAGIGTGIAAMTESGRKK
jgi:hypothetical protein